MPYVREGLPYWTTENISLGKQENITQTTWKNIKSHLNESNALKLSNAMLGTLYEGFVLHKIVFTSNGVCKYHNIYYQKQNKVNLMNSEALISFRKERRFSFKKTFYPPFYEKMKDNM